MGANRIKGITIEIGGDTTKLQTALKGVNSQVSVISQFDTAHYILFRGEIPGFCDIIR